ncbi:MAG: Crp/Fnr family transcriptional regulator [Alphaproteobacteria bacterium]|nr:Crp/Fnr family transcriptional regulator [Alphaproteobacteria bacterium]
MSEDFIGQLIATADKRRMLAQGTHLFHQGDRVSAIFVVEEGLVELTRHQRDGAPIVLQRATRQTVLAEASVYSETYHCDAVVALPASVCEIPKAAFLERLREDDAFSGFWAAHLAREVQGARYRSEILSRKTVAERLDGWLTWHGNELPAKGQWKGLAGQIGVSPEALYRELAKRRPE